MVLLTIANSTMLLIIWYRVNEVVSHFRQWSSHVYATNSRGLSVTILEFEDVIVLHVALEVKIERYIV